MESNGETGSLGGRQAYQAYQGYQGRRESVGSCKERDQANGTLDSICLEGKRMSKKEGGPIMQVTFRKASGASEHDGLTLGDNGTHWEKGRGRWDQGEH